MLRPASRYSGKGEENMNDPFHSSKYKIERAKHHVSEFERQVVEFHNTNPYAHVTEIDPNTSEQVHKYKLVKPMPVALQGIADEAVYNLRSALDQVGYAIAIAAGKNGKRAHFPFGDDAVQLENNINRGTCKDLPNEIVDLIRSFKPYKGGNDLLWALNKLCNTNKHASICPVAVLSGGVHFNQGHFTGGGPSISAHFWNRTKNEMELFRVRPGTTYNVNFQFSAFVAFRDVEFVDGAPVLAVLNEFVRIVEGVVMALEAETRRLGLV
jgi:hypothetical protein